jgi:hypothetical protein
MRNAVKKRMIKKAIEMVGKVPGAKYPKGSYIMFTAEHNKDEKPESVSCCWYDKVGGKMPYKHIVSNPPEWQNISMEEADKIVEMFDKYLYMPGVCLINTMERR